MKHRLLTRPILWLHRDAEGESYAVFCVLHIAAAPMQIDDAFDDGKTKPRADTAASGVNTVETVPDMFQSILRKGIAVIFNYEICRSVLFIYHDPDAAVVGGILYSIVCQVRDNLPNSAFVSRNSKLFRLYKLNSQLPLLGRMFYPFKDLSCHFC